MSEELGRIEKPEAEKFAKSRKLLFVPLIFSPLQPDEEIGGMIRSYWDEVETHLVNLEMKLGSVSKVFHEMVDAGGEEGGKVIRAMNSAGYKVIGARVDKGAEILAIEDTDQLTEFMDWSRCLAIGLENQKVFGKVYELYVEAFMGRNRGMAQKIDEALNEDDVGILIMREGHQLQFPPDIEVFYIAPRALDEIKRWVRSREGKPETGEQATGEGTAEEKPEAEKDVDSVEDAKADGSNN